MSFLVELPSNIDYKLNIYKLVTGKYIEQKKTSNLQFFN